MNMEKPSAIKKIERHWTEYLLSKGENPLKHALRSYHDWYLVNMSPDQEIDEYYEQIHKSQQMDELKQRIVHLDQVERWVVTERDEIHRLVNEVDPYN